MGLSRSIKMIVMRFTNVLTLPRAKCLERILVKSQGELHSLALS